MTGDVLESVFDQLFAHRVHLEGIVLKPNMVISGKKCAQRASATEVAAATVRCLKRFVPAAVPGIAFLSGGQSRARSDGTPDPMNQIGGLPWALTFSYGRALQASALKTWGGKADSLAAGQTAFLKRARLNGLAQLGKYAVIARSRLSTARQQQPVSTEATPVAAAARSRRFCDVLRASSTRSTASPCSTVSTSHSPRRSHRDHGSERHRQDDAAAADHRADLLPTAASVLVDGRDVGRMKRNEIYALRRRMGMLFQNGALLTDLDVFENVAFPLREHTRLPERLIRNIVLTKLHAVGLRGAASLMPQQLSGGMARRVALARAIAMDPDILIYDEPFAGLDPISMGVVMRLIRSLNDALGITSIVVTHDVREISQIADASYILSEGTCGRSGTPAN